jgi:hypothetical protein
LFQIESINISQRLSLGIVTAQSALNKAFFGFMLTIPSGKIAVINLPNISEAACGDNFNSFGARSYNWPHRAPVLHIHHYFAVFHQQPCRSQSPYSRSGTVALRGGPHGSRPEEAAQGSRIDH